MTKAEKNVQALLFQTMQSNSATLLLELQYAQSILSIKKTLADKVLTGDLKDNPVWESEKARQALMNILQSSDIVPGDITQFQATLNEVRALMAIKP